MGKRQQANLPVLIIASLLWGLDPADASNELPVARSVLADSKAPPPMVEAVCRIIGGRDPGGPEELKLEYALLAEADRLAARKTAE